MVELLRSLECSGCAIYHIDSLTALTALSMQKKWLIVNDPKAFHNIFLKEQDIYFEENSCVRSELS